MIYADPVNPNTNCDCYDEGVCRLFGERWEKNCFTYECRRNGASWIGAVVGAGKACYIFMCPKNRYKKSKYLQV